MNKEMKELIEKLKKPELAQARALLTDQERAIFDKAGPGNMLWLNGAGDWTSPGTGKVRGNTYILKPDYEPGPEHINCVVYVVGGHLCYELVRGHNRDVHSMELAVRDKDFVGFYIIGHDLDNGGDETKIRPEDVAMAIRNGHKVYARFIQE